MAKGTLVFEFESALDLENQMRAYLRLPQLQEVTLGEGEQTADMVRGVLGKPGDGMTFSVSSVEPVSTMHQRSISGRAEARQRSITCASSLTIMFRQIVGRAMALRWARV